jgi:hypothetical protein
VAQAVIVVATFAYNTAMRPEKLPRKAGLYNSGQPGGKNGK